MARILVSTDVPYVTVAVDEGWNTYPRGVFPTMLTTPEWNKYVAEIRARAGTLLAEITRHCDTAGAVHIEQPRGYICSFCGSEWEETEDGCPCCCEKDVEEWFAEKEGADEA